MEEIKATTEGALSTDKPLVTVPLTKEWQERQSWESTQRLQIRQEYEALLQVWKGNELATLEQKQAQIIQDGLVKLFNKWKEEQKPPTHEDIQNLLNQEYGSFRVKVEFFGDNDEPKSEMFTLTELPQSIERKFFRLVKKAALEKASALQSFAQAGVDRPYEEQIKAFLEVFDEGFDLLAEAVVMCLNPRGKKEWLTKTWVQDNMNSDRMWTICEAQAKVSRIKDFFSKVSRSGQETMTMMRPLNIQQLQQLVAS